MTCELCGSKKIRIIRGVHVCMLCGHKKIFGGVTR